MIPNHYDVERQLSGRMSIRDIRSIARIACVDARFKEILIRLAQSGNNDIGYNALWCMTHAVKEDCRIFASDTDLLINMLLQEEHNGKRRMLLQILRDQEYQRDKIRSDFLDYCLSKINAECEPYAIRAFSIYCAFKMCRFFPELINELNAHLDMLTTQALSPGLKSALRITRNRINNQAKRIPSLLS